MKDYGCSSTQLSRTYYRYQSDGLLTFGNSVHELLLRRLALITSVMAFHLDEVLFE